MKIRTDDYYILFNGVRWIVSQNGKPRWFVQTQQEAIDIAKQRAKKERVNVIWTDKHAKQEGCAVYRPSALRPWRKLWKWL